MMDLEAQLREQALRHGNTCVLLLARYGDSYAGLTNYRPGVDMEASGEQLDEILDEVSASFAASVLRSAASNGHTCAHAGRGE